MAESGVQSAYTVAHIAGIPVRVHFTWFFVLALFVWSLGAAVFPNDYPGWAPGAYWATAVVAALLFFVSVLLHELSHSLLARARGLPVESITLFIFGGVSQIGEESRSPGAEFWIAVVGPLTSFLIAVVCWFLTPFGFAVSGPVGAVLLYLAQVNLLVGIFNMLPGFPLDGGRVLRALLWAGSNNLIRATRWAAFVGRVLAFGMIAIGILLAFTGNFGGLWLAFIGWFLDSAAQATASQTELRGVLGDARVVEAMQRDVRTVVPALPVSALVEDYLEPGPQRAFPVVGGGRIWGIVSLSDVARLARDQWPTTPVEAIMTARDRLVTVRPNDSVERLMSLMTEAGVKQVPVIDGNPDQLVGMVNWADLMTFIELRQKLRARL